MKKYKFILLIILSISSILSQAQNSATLVEHFTNTVCSVCASRNPGLYNNLRSQKDVLHIAYHPSSPYSSCILNQHNKSANDARTNYYNVYGGTPRIVLNGVVQSSSSNYASTDIFTPFKNIATNLSILVNQIVEGDLIKSTISVKRLTTATLGNLKLHVMYVEDTLFYNAPNGESQHYDVFRKAATNIQGVDLTIPTTINDSVITLTQTNTNSAWNKNRIYTLAFVQNTTDKSILNVAKSTASKVSNTSLKTLNDLGINVYPNPANDYLTIELSKYENTNITLLNILGDVVLNKQIKNSEKLELSNLSKGIYFLSIENLTGKATQKLIIK
jgi:hypothetical protein